MEARTRFFSTMDIERRENLLRSEDDIDLDFDVTDSARTIAHLVANDDRHDDSDMDFSISSSVRTVEHHFPSDIAIPGAPLPTSSSGSCSSNLRGMSNSLHFGKKSQPRAIPTTIVETTTSTQVPQSSETSSYGSSGSAFLSGILNNHTLLSHTPPVATSYENTHFGKRHRVGSVSGRLRSASDLEEKGLIDREQKSVLKDLIICGDHELHNALDLYETGETSQLETLIHSGALSSKAMPDLDLLGDLDMDFLSVNDPPLGDVDSSSCADRLQQQPLHAAARSVPASTSALNDLATQFQEKQPINENLATASMVSPEYDDGIGELEFTGDFSDTPDFLSVMQQSQNTGSTAAGDRSRSNSIFSEVEMGRSRSNSLFSALLNETQRAHEQEMQFGRWMDQVPKKVQIPKEVHAKAPIPRRVSELPPKSVTKESPKKGGIGAVLENHKKMTKAEARAQLKEQQAEDRRRLKQEKKEYKEKEKQRKKEERLRLKLEKKRAAEEEKEREEHLPGSGKPRRMSDPLLRTSVDENGLLNVDRPDGWVGAYSPESRIKRIERFLEKRNHRVWAKTVKYDVRKNFADSRLRVKGRFVKKEDELLMRELMSLT